MACAIEDANFEIRDQILWIYGSGFPKSLDISKAIDKKFGTEREIIGKYTVSEKCADGQWQNKDRKDGKGSGFKGGEINITAPSTPQAKQWSGWGTALKPAHEPMVLARKPLSEKTVAENVLKWGTGGININDCRVVFKNELSPTVKRRESTTPINYKEDGKWPDARGESYHLPHFGDNLGRWPANFIHDGSEEVVSLFPSLKSSKGSGLTKTEARSNFNNSIDGIDRIGYNDEGSASRFFYCAKASKKDRNEGLDGFELKEIFPQNNSIERKELNSTKQNRVANNHPTVKPTDLMAYLVRLVTPKNGLVLDPFNGSGSTGKACAREGFNYIGIDLSQEYLDISKARIEFELNKGE